jgi:xanthine dehydrogenase accessory factor
MTEETSVLVFGMDERASAIARKLHLDGHAVALHQPSPPTTIRRRMAFADAWYEGSATFEGVEARRSDKAKDFLAGLRSGQFIPILWHNFDEVTERWPWDVLVDASPGHGRAKRPMLKTLADLSIGVGPGFVAGEHCDIVIDTRAGDPGAVLRSGGIPEPEMPRDDAFSDGTLVYSPEGGLFQVSRFIGETVNPGEVLGFVGMAAVEAPAAGRLRGLARDGASLAKGAPVAEIAASTSAEVVGICKRDRLIARSVAFVIEMERAGWSPISLESLFLKP